ncbi:hypothetical protein ACMD2_25425 [Ananas comosus]|uniref:Uncharacterized protein n=1 Tax=Ananas comosus TaxID=4615 RepID=A0A199VFW8_ANACO|nr:hypothetical protein ACMD2_25425 [Ananas comosus]
MAGQIIPSLGRVRLADLVACDGLPSDSYKISVTTLTQSLAQYSAAIVQLPSSDGALLRSGLESARLFFHQHAYPWGEMVHTNDSREWCKTSVLGKVARDILDAISFSLNLRSFSFTEILDNLPLRNREISSSVLSVCCHSRPSFQEAQHHSLAAQEDGQLVMFQDHEHQFDKTLFTIVKADRAGLHNGDRQLAGKHIWTVLFGFQAHAEIHGEFKLLRDEGSWPWCEAQFQIPIPVDDFMQRSHPTDLLFTKSNLPTYTFHTDKMFLLTAFDEEEEEQCKDQASAPSKDCVSRLKGFKGAGSGDCRQERHQTEIL